EPDVGALVAPVLDEAHRTRFERSGEVDLAYAAEGAGRFRVNVFRHHGGVGAVFRFIPTRIPSREELRIPAEVERFTGRRSGLVLVAGPTGSGKSSTLAALLDLVNRRDALHVITIEDPIEFVHADDRCTFTQREVGRDTDSFAAALRSAARQDPDLILVGEMRDRETIQLALTLAEMGMLVFSTVHTNSTARTVDRIVEVFPEESQRRIRGMLAGSLRGVLSQTLCRRADAEGRVPATELMFSTTGLRSIIRDGASHKILSVLQAGRAGGMHTMDDSLFRLARDGVIEGLEAWRKAADKSRFLTFLS
ncbi:MAG: type IV pilus twitching motility protein PilT, partial [Acidobacteriota bacterium]